MIELNKISKKEIEVFIKLVDRNFAPPLSERLDLVAYSEKLFQKASTIFIYKKNKPVSGIFFYKDPESRIIYIPLVATLTQFQGKGYFQLLLNELFKLLKGTLYNIVKLETWQGSKALNYYIKSGFRIEEKVLNRENNFSIKLFKRINQKIDSISFCETPLYKDEKLSVLTSNNLYIKRDDLFPVLGGGSKGRKLFYILKEALRDGVTTIITCGSNQSSHLRVTASLCAQLGLKSRLVVHDTKLIDKTINVKLIDFYADEVTYCNLQEVKKVMDQAVDNAVAANEKPLYIFGGGHCLEGTYAYYDAVHNLYDSHIIENLDYVFVASGTGTTQAGLHTGMTAFFPNCKVIGISISRDMERGIEVIEQSIKQFLTFQGCEANICGTVDFDDAFLDGGYGKSTVENNIVISTFSKQYGLSLDPTYSGKAFLGMLSRLKEIKGKNILFWNTGSTLNFIDNL